MQIEANARQKLELRATNGERLQLTLLSLPPEIRNIIYYFVLGGRSYHVYAHGNHAWTAGSTNDSKRESTIRSLIQLYECVVHQHDAKREWLDEHLACFVNSAHRELPHANLLRVCKQIYDETALIPYASNTFVFIAPPSFEKFLLHTLNSEQVKAIRRIAMWSPIGSLPLLDDDVSWKHWGIPQQVKNRDLFSGLQYLDFNFSIYDEMSLGNLEEVESMLEVAKVARSDLRIKMMITLNEIGRGQDEDEVDVALIAEHVNSLWDGKTIGSKLVY